MTAYDDTGKKAEQDLEVELTDINTIEEAESMKGDSPDLEDDNSADL